MMKGFKTLFAAMSLAAICSASYAMAPTVRTLPDVTIGDAGDNIGATDNNWFVFTNAFKFDDYVSDADTTVSDLKWSFDELEDATQQWYTINGKTAVHTGTAAVAVDDTSSDSAHLNPDSLRAVSQYASFRDIVLSPGPGDGPYSDPTVDHSAGRLVRFFVSDGFNVVRANPILVKTVDDGNDAISGGMIFTPYPDVDDTFDSSNIYGVNTTDITKGWQMAGMTTNAQSSYSGGLVRYDWDSVNQAYRSRVLPCNSTSPTASDYRFRTALIFANQAEWLPYSAVGSDKYVRVKYSIYAQAGSGGFADANRIPNFRLRVSERFALTQQLEVNHHQILSDAGNLNWARELRPSTDPTKPSIYRVDLAPIPVAYLINTAGEGFARGFEAFALEPQEDGYICCSEATIGAYPKAATEGDNSRTLQEYKTMNDLKVWNAAAEKGDYGVPYNMTIPSGYQEGGMPGIETSGSDVGSYTENTSGVGINFVSSNVPAAKIGIITRDFNPDANTLNNAIHPRVQPDRQYKLRFHLTSTQSTNKQAGIWLRARSIKFAWSYKVELAGAWATGGTEGTDVQRGANNCIAQQSIPGVGTQNPDHKTGVTNGGWYTLMMHTPMSMDIAADRAGADLTARMPNISGEKDFGNSADSRRDIRVGMNLIDTLSSGNTAAQEQGQVTLDEIDITDSPLVAD